MSQDALAKRLFLILHQPFSGKPDVSPDLLRCGVVCAELGDLIVARKLGMENNLVVLAPHRRSGTDEISAFVIDSIQRQSSAHTVRTWVSAFADVLYDLVARSLVADGVVHREERGTLLRRGPDRFPAADLIAAAGPRLELEHRLRNPSPHDVRGNVLAAILGALGVARVLDVDGDRSRVQVGITQATAALPIDLRHLVDGVTDAVGAVSLIIRR